MGNPSGRDAITDYIFTTAEERLDMSEDDIISRLDQLKCANFKLLIVRNETYSFTIRMTMSALLKRMDREKMILENMLDKMRF